MDWTPRRLVGELQRCGKERNLEEGRHLHSFAIQYGCHREVHIATSLISMYRRCGEMTHARDVFDGMEERNVVSWTALIFGYVENGESLVALDVFESMDCAPNLVTLVAAIKACTGLADSGGFDRRFCLEKGAEVHRRAKRLGFDTDTFVSNSLIVLCGRCKDMHQADVVFQRLRNRSSVTWNVLMFGYVENGEFLTALDLYDNMDCRATRATFLVALKACACLAMLNPVEKEKCLRKGAHIHGQASFSGYDKDLFVSNALVDLYSKCGDMTSAFSIFSAMERRDVVSWNVLILGYLLNGQSESALEVFDRMDVPPDHVTLVTVLKACGSLCALGALKRIHDQVCELGWEQEEMVATCLLDAYAKCGDMRAAEDLFHKMPSQNVLAWSALIGGYSSLCDAPQVFKLIKRMHESGMDVDKVVMLLALTSCSHAGMVDQGAQCFQRMWKYGVHPTIDHHVRVVEMLGRANRLEEALRSIQTMRMRSSRRQSVVWLALLDSCNRWGNLEVGKVAFQVLLDLEADEKTFAVACVLMRNIYRMAMDL